MLNSELLKAKPQNLNFKTKASTPNPTPPNPKALRSAAKQTSS